MSFQRFKPLEFVYEYDHAIDGGLIGDINLRLVGNNRLNAQTTITGLTVYFLTSITHNSQPAIILGNSLDDDGFFKNFVSVATAGNVMRIGDFEGDLLWDKSNKSEKIFKPSSLSEAQPILKVSSFNVTGGKFRAIFNAVRMD